MSDLRLVLLLALLPGVATFLGGILAEVTRISAPGLNRALHAASGVVIAIVAVELMPEAVETLAGWWIALAFACGGVAYVLLEEVVERLQGTADAGRSRMWMIYAAVVLDLTSDGLMIGTGSSLSAGLAVVLAAGQVLADVPEGYATVANFRDKGVPRGRRILFAASFVVYVPAAALAAYFLLHAAPEPARRVALVFVAGLLTVAAEEDMLEEAHQAREDARWSVLAFVGGFALFTLLSAGLEQLVGVHDAPRSSSPGAGVGHRLPGLARREGRALLQELDRDPVGRADERHVAVARRTVDRHAGVHQPLARRVDVLDLVGEVAEVAPAGELLRVPVVGELDLPALLVGRCGEEHERVAAGRVLVPPQLPEPELVAVEVQRALEVRDADHGVQVSHASLSIIGRRQRERTARIARSSDWRRRKKPRHGSVRAARSRMFVMLNDAGSSAGSSSDQSSGAETGACGRRRTE